VRLLLVSGDARVSAQVTTALMGQRDLDVVEVATPQRALALIDDGEAFDIVVADNDTHPTGGFYLAREVAARREVGEEVPPVVLLLARAQDAWLSDWAQADAWLLKPVDPFDLAEVDDALAGGRPVPALPGVGGDPRPHLLAADTPAVADRNEAEAASGTAEETAP
jgi:CheY-like chemotaxis protein